MTQIDHDTLRDGEITNFDLKPAQFKAAAERTTETLLKYFESIQAGRVLPEMGSKEIEKLLSEPLPLTAQDPLKILGEVETKIIPNSTKTGSPRFFGFVVGSGTMMSVFGDAIAAAINQNVGVWKVGPAASELERLVVRWFSEIIGYDKEAGGLLLSGGSMANTTAIATALRDKAGYDIVNEGLQSDKRAGKFLLYMSDHEGHHSVVKAAQFLGLGRDSVKRVRSNEDFTMNLESLEEAIERDAREGNIPFCVVGQVGSINVGAVDPLREISEICARHKLWFHADGSVGGFGKMIPKKAKLFEGLELCDSVTLDPHKWLYVSYDCGCLLVKNPEKLTNAFSLLAPYLRGTAPSQDPGLDFTTYGLELSRGFRALKVWMSVKQYGIETYRKLLERDIMLAEYLDQLVRRSPEFEPLCRPVLQMYCFRFVPRFASLSEAKLNALNQGIADSIQRSGIAFLMTTSIRGKTALRFSITNHRTTRNDVKLTFDELGSIGRELAESLG